MTLKFYIGRIFTSLGKAKLLGGFSFKFEIVIYGRKDYKFRKRIKMLKKKARREEL